MPDEAPAGFGPNRLWADGLYVSIVRVEVDAVGPSVIAPQAVQALQVLTILLGAPLVSGVIAHFEARLQGRRGPRILQPYYDIAKLFHKETLAPEDASWVFLACPIIAFACYLTVPLLIPVLTSYPLPLGYMGDILGGGFILALAGFSIALGRPNGRAVRPAREQPSDDLRRSRRALDPVRHLHRGTRHHDRPALLRGRRRTLVVSQVVRPAHLLAAFAFFLVVLADTGRIPVETHAGTLEFGMIDEARTLEHSGPPSRS